MIDFFAHSKNQAHKKHLLKDHLTAVAELVCCFSGGLPWTEEAVLAGQLHDLGKYADLFQARLRGEVSGLDHWSPGAWVALKEYQSVAATLAIQGHHIGLQEGSKDALQRLNPVSLAQRHPLNLKLSDSDVNCLKCRFSGDGLTISKPDNLVIEPQKGFQNPVATMLDVRLIFSCLTDADFLDTEAHFEGYEDGKQYRDIGPLLDTTPAITALDAFVMDRVRSENKADIEVKDARDALWKMVNKSAKSDPGLFTLTAPTGSGKTLAMLKFALEHARRNQLNRIILAVPFLSIIEQTAAVYREVFKGFPANYVLEHHSLAGLGRENAEGDAETNSVDQARRLLSENWDAPVIITTNVQLLESLFSNRPSVCRKLHNLLNAVILFDEAQTLPQALAVPTLAALSHISQAYHSSILFATATQPAFDFLDASVKEHVPAGWITVEAAPDHPKLYDKLKRYEVKWPRQGETQDWVHIADELRSEKQVLCVVNLKSHAAILCDDLKHDDDIFHISTNLCALHRRNVLEKVSCRLKPEVALPCRLISTQCIEAGVDVDFPVVYRALSPLDSIAQAAGRCNREGRLIDDTENRKMGEVRVFEPAVEGDYRRRYPSLAYFQAAEVTRSMLIEAGMKGLDLNNPAVFRDYYRRLYDLSKPEAQNKALVEAFTALDFVRVAQEYRLIEQSAIQVLVPYSPYRDIFEKLQRDQDYQGINAKWMRCAQGLAVSVFRPNPDHPAWEVLIPAKLRYGKGTSDEWYILEDRKGNLYDAVFGLRLPQSQQILIG